MASPIVSTLIVLAPSDQAFPVKHSSPRGSRASSARWPWPSARRGGGSPCVGMGSFEELRVFVDIAYDF